MSRNSIQTIITLFLLSSAMISNECQAEVKIGVGAAVSPYPSTYIVSMPMKIGDQFMLEPSIGNRKRKTEVEYEDGFQYEYTFDSLHLAMGLYGVRKIKTDFEMYYGAGIGVETFDDEFNVTSDGANTYTYRWQWVFVQPTLGISYFVNSNFSISIDLGLYVYKEKTEITNDYGGVIESDSERIDTSGVETGTNLIFRYMF